jgi:hypothetical protein
MKQYQLVIDVVEIIKTNNESHFPWLLNNSKEEDVA